jgi:hypothetical protein
MMKLKVMEVLTSLLLMYSAKDQKNRSLVESVDLTQKANGKEFYTQWGAKIVQSNTFTKLKVF